MSCESEFSYCIVCLEQPPGDPEHIIPKVIGGRLRARLLCNKCNHRFGTDLVSRLKSDPSVRLAVEALKGDVPDLYEKLTDKALFSGMASDGSIIQASKRRDRVKILPSRGAGGSIIRDTAGMTTVLRTILQRGGATEQQIALNQSMFANLEEDIPLRLPTGHTLVKRRTPPLVAQLGTELVSDRLWALIALEFLSLVIYEDIYRRTLDPVRQYVMTESPSDTVAVEHFSSGDRYDTFHALLLDPQEQAIRVQIRLFRLLVHVVTFKGIEYTGPDPVYLEDLKSRRSFVTLTRADARQRKWL